jgi:hypothetical protein
LFFYGLGDPNILRLNEDKEETTMKPGRILSLALTSVSLLGIAVVLWSCCDPPTEVTCPQGECWMWKPENFKKCNYSLACDDTDPLQLCTPYNLRNTGT